MTDIASLGIKVSTSGVKEADKQLGDLAQTSERTAQSIVSAASEINKGFKPDTSGVKAQRDELQKLSAQVEPTVAALDRLEKKEKQVGSAGGGLATGAKEAERALASLASAGEKASTQAAKIAPQMSKAALSANELKFATRQLPMQFTDIATSLASGQRPLQVLLQQGGQLKDVFGGVGPAIRALGGYVLGLVNPLTIAAAAVVGLGLAWKAAIDEEQAFNLALIKTGHYAADSAEDLEALAERLDDTTDATQRFASNVVAQIAATGRISSDQLGIVSAAVTNMAKATQAAGGDADEAIKSLTKSFTDLSRDPVDALLKLNDTQHFLTAATLEQVESLVEQGKEAEAAKVAIRAFADETNRGAKEIEQSINSASAVWSGFKNVIGESTEEVINFFRNADAGLQAFILRHEAAARSLVKIQSMVTPVLPFGQLQQSASQSLLNGARAGLEPTLIGFKPGAKVNSDAERKRIREVEDAQRQWNSSIRQGENDAARLKRELDEAAAAGKRLGKTGAEIEAAQDAIRASFARKGPKGRKPRKQNDRSIENASDRFDDMVGSLRVELSGPMERVEQQHIKRMRELEQAARDGKRSHEDLTAALKLEGEAYKSAANDVQFRIDAEVAGLSGPIAQAQQNHEAALRRIEELKQQGLVTGEQFTAMLREEAKAYQADMAAAERAADPIGALLSDMREELDLIGLSNAQRDVMVALRHENIDAMSAEGQAALNTAKAFEEEAKAKQRSIELMDTFRSGAADALTDIATGAKSAKDALLDFFDSLIERLIHLTAERLIEKAFGSMGTTETGSAGGSLGQIAAAIFGGGRASGGPVSPNRLYEVGEHNKPELLQMHGRSFLIPGNQGNVTPIRDAANEPRRGDINQTNNYYVAGSMDRRAREAVRYDNSRNLNRASRRNG